MAMIPAQDWRGEMRRVLRERNYEFCDDEAPQQLPAAQLEEAISRGEVEAGLLHLGLDSSSCDREGQDIDNTLDDEYTFWSSAGTSPEADEHLTYCFKFPLCRLTRVDIKVFRATFQFGDPIYPAQQVSFKIGSSRQQLWQVPGRFQMLAMDDWQSFPMPANVPIGQLLMVCLHRKCQMQWGDRRFYIALQAVRAAGASVPAGQVETFRRHMRCCPALQLPGGSMLPAPAAYSPQLQDASSLKAVTVLAIASPREGYREAQAAGQTASSADTPSFADGLPDSDVMRCQQPGHVLFHGKGLVRAA